MTEIKVFISYCHDSDDHRVHVLALSERLRKDGIDTLLDQYFKKGPPAEGWPRWMQAGLKTSNFVLCVCNENYYRRFSGDETCGQGRRFGGRFDHVGSVQ